ncbi:acyl-CoA thioesterase [Mesobacterium pallidum]|uniref:acyl-CoA thioesterase n=1 Tax=Mesobacterium pallidum TaxID=2872037 RepID=UPI003AB956F4
MNEILDAFVKVLDVEPVEANFFRGLPQPGAKGRTFGGQVIAQALMSAIKTVEPDKPAHSLHAYFMRGGDATAPVLYRVERDRDGRSFATRRVIAIQNGQPILNLAASFHHVEDGWSHQDPLPDVPPPEDLPDETELGERMADQLPEETLEFLRRPKPVEIRPVIPRPPFDRSPRPPVQRVWIRAVGPMPDDPALHRAGLAFASDFALMGTAMVPHALAFGDPDIMTASLDHALWLHEDFRFDDWLLYDMDSPWSGGARGLNRGRFFTRDGRLVAEAVQEGLMRPIRPRT